MRLTLHLTLLAALSLVGCSVGTAPTPSPRATATLHPTLTLSAPATQSLTPIQLWSPTAASATATQTTIPPAPTATPTRPANASPTATAPPTILTFTFAPAQIDPGGAVTLTWNVAGAEQVTIYRVLDYRLTLPAYEVPLTGSQVFTTYKSERNFASFVLFATAGEQPTQAGLTIPIRCPDLWFFGDPPAECPMAALATNLVAQNFEHGQMLWAAGNDRIYILYAGGQRWSAIQNGWFEGLPESDPTLIPPEGYYQPVRGFGLAWRDEQATPGYRVRDQLGWAIDEEYIWGAGAVQCTAVTKYSTCYLGGPGGVVYRLKPEGSGWEIWPGPAP